MRIDKYLKLSRIIKRRTIAKDACDAGKVFINGKQASPSDHVDVGDRVNIYFGEKSVSIKVTSIKEHVPKDSAAGLYEEIAVGLDKSSVEPGNLSTANNICKDSQQS